MGERLRIVTVNMLHERGDVSSLADILDRRDPDVAVVQELAPEAAELLESRYPQHRLAPRLDYTGRGIATRFGAEFGDIDMPRRPGMWAGLDVDGVVVRLANVHFSNPIDFPWWASVAARRRQLEALMGWIDDAPGPVVVAGDFNASPVWPAYRRMTGRLNDAVADRARRGGSKPEPTWGWRPGWPRMLRIDHVFASADVTASQVAVDEISGSDHWAVVVDLEISGAPG